jgi:hypothetical protein
MNFSQKQYSLKFLIDFIKKFEEKSMTQQRTPCDNPKVFRPVLALLQ